MTVFASVASQRPIPILTFHQIASEPPKGTGFRSLCVDPQDFAAHMVFLHALGWQGLSMSALMPYLCGERQGKVFGITFDDGYLNNLTHAAPVLQRLGFSATCYVVSDMLGQSNAWDLENGVPPSELMAAPHLRLWLDAGQELGAHTRNHVRLTTLDAATCRDEVAGCKAEIEQITGAPVQHFCYPYGEFTQAHVEQVARAGYQTATTTQRGRCQRGDALLQLPRVPVLRRTGRALLWWKLVSGYEDRRRA